jgi:hypothetical protein
VSTIDDVYNVVKHRKIDQGASPSDGTESTQKNLDQFAIGKNLFEELQLKLAIHELTIH